jgi:polyhydroxyalkanoate synthesis regulator phasin
MTERLDRIEAILEGTTAKQQSNADGIETLMAAVSTNLTSCRELRAAGAASDARIDRLVVKIDESNQRFDIQRGEAQADRQETRRLFNDAVIQMERDRAESRNRFEAVLTEIREAQRKADERHAAQMEVIQTLLIELTKSNGNISAVNSNVNNLRDRIDGLEQAS